MVGAMINGQRLLLSTSKILLLLVFITVVPVSLTAQIWTVLAVDPKGDGRPVVA